ncbi:hypothetical protein V5P93_001123 [Actinokineospora auranticolor]|uniref:Uncharacterized protein n=1 Tax=Actinokineospora auranticolor TaxID=155976 RepID=A0A2S6GB51_9PSEU|nr:hypothetical protein [Actinokineospora auranticolor]PPK60826.1 hypothetical protein CLV40_14711 [Actinokineospora auranticolor]
MRSNQMTLIPGGSLPSRGLAACGVQVAVRPGAWRERVATFQGTGVFTEGPNATSHNNTTVTADLTALTYARGIDFVQVESKPSAASGWRT